MHQKIYITRTLFILIIFSHLLSFIVLTWPMKHYIVEPDKYYLDLMEKQVHSL
jgi:hypothetical protein